jgi:two-component system NarL family response regulator
MLDHALPDAESAPLRIMVVDDHELFRRGLTRLLDEQDGLEVVADARSGEEALKRASEVQADVIVMDINMPGISGVAATRELRTLSPRSAIIILTVNADEAAVLDAVLAGASGYLLKDATFPEIVRGIHAAAAGESLIAPAVAAGLLGRLRRQGVREAHEGDDPKLTPRELDVLRLIVAGCENTAIAKRLHLSASTVKRHVSNTVEKLGVENRIQAAVVAVRRGLVDDDDARSG